MTYKNHTIRTAQNSLGNWIAFVDDASGNTLGQTPAVGEWGKDTEQEVVTQAKRIITHYQNSYEPTEN